VASLYGHDESISVFAEDNRLI